MRLKTLVIGVLVWRILLFAVGVMSEQSFEYAPTFAAVEFIRDESNLPKQLYSWANFDGVHYFTIIKKGYLGTGSIQAFFPLWPLTILTLTSLGGNPIIIGLLLNSILVVATLPIASKAFELSKKHAILFCLVFLSFPTSLFLSAFYTEALFIFLTVSALALAKDKRFFVAALTAGLASATKVVGLAVGIGVLFIWLSQQKKRLQIVQGLALGVLSISGFLLFSMYLWVNFDDPLYFLSVQSSFGHDRSSGVFVLQTLYRTIKIVLFTQINWRWLTSLLEMLSLGGALTILTQLSYKFIQTHKNTWKDLSPKAAHLAAWLLCSWLFICIPASTGSGASMQRYVLPALPIFIWIASKLESASKPVQALYFLVSTLLLCINTLLFLQGYWVA